MTTTPLAYTIRRAAEATGLSPSTIRRACDAGDIATTSPLIDGKPVRGRLIPAAELERWLRSVA